VEVAYEFQNFKISSSKIEKTLLTGNPADRTAKPFSEIIDLQENKITLPAYSFMVLRMKNNCDFR